MKCKLAVIISLATAMTWTGCSREEPNTPTDVSGITDPGRVQTTLSIPANLDVIGPAEGCSTELDKGVSYSGDLTVPQIFGRIIFQNNEKGTHTHIEDILVETALVDAGQVVHFNCAQGAVLANLDAGLPSPVDLIVTTGGCETGDGPYIAISGEIRLGGDTDAIIIPEGETIIFSKQPPLDGVGGNPWVSFQFVDATGGPMSEVFLLGRCVQLSR